MEILTQEANLVKSDLPKNFTTRQREAYDTIAGSLKGLTFEEASNVLYEAERAAKKGAVI